MMPASRKRTLFLSFAILYGFTLLFDLTPWLRGPDEWHWWAAPPVPIGRWLSFAGTIILFVGGWWLGGKWLQKQANLKRIIGALLLLYGLITLVQFSLLALFRDNPIALQYEYVVSNQVNGYWSASLELGDIQTALREFPARMPAFTADPHPRSKPPAIVLLFWGTERLLAQMPTLANAIGQWARGIRCGDLWLVMQSNSALASAVVVGILTPLWSALASVPAFFLAKQRWGVHAGWLAAGLVAIMPGRLLFTPNMDTLYPLLTLLALWFVDKGWRQNSLGWTFASGLLLSLLTFFSLVNGLSGLVVGCFLLFSWLLTSKPPWKTETIQLVKHGVALALGSATIWLIYWTAYQVSVYDIYVAAAPARNDLRRSYGLWLGWNIVDVALFVGLPAFLLAFYKPRRAYLPLYLAFWLPFLLFNATGQIRAEVGRIWLMIAGIPCVLAAAHYKQETHKRLLLLSSMAFITFAMGLRWEVNPLEWPPPTPHAYLTELPAISHPQTIAFGQEIDLLGYDKQGDSITLYWQAKRAPQVMYTLFTHVVDNAGNIVRQSDVMPIIPTTCWQPEQIMMLEQPLFPEFLPSDTHTIYIGLYNHLNGERIGTFALEDF